MIYGVLDSNKYYGKKQKLSRIKKIKSVEGMGGIHFTGNMPFEQCLKKVVESHACVWVNIHG